MSRSSRPTGIARATWPSKQPAAKFEALLPLANRLAKNAAMRVPPGLLPDLRSAAFLGAWLVSLRHPVGDPDYLKRYAVRRITGAILDELRRQDYAPRRLRKQDRAWRILRFDDLGKQERDDALSAPAEVELSLDDLARNERLYEAMSSLPERDRFVLMQVDVRERPQQEVASELGISAARVSQLRTRALGRLREAMGSLD